MKIQSEIQSSFTKIKPKLILHHLWNNVLFDFEAHTVQFLGNVIWITVLIFKNVWSFKTQVMITVASMPSANGLSNQALSIFLTSYSEIFVYY